MCAENRPYFIRVLVTLLQFACLIAICYTGFTYNNYVMLLQK